MRSIPNDFTNYFILLMKFEGSPSLGLFYSAGWEESYKLVFKISWEKRERTRRGDRRRLSVKVSIVQVENGS